MIPTQNIGTILLTHTAVQGLLLFLLLLWIRTGNAKARWSVAVLVLLFALETFNFLFEYFQWSQHWPHLIWASAPAWFLVGPVVWLFAQYSIKAGFRLRWWHGLHLLPFFMAVWYLSFFYMVSAEQKLQYYQEFYQPGYQSWNWFLYGYLLSMLIYIGRAAWQFRRYFDQLGKQYAQSEAFALYWIKWLLAVLAVFVLISLVYDVLLHYNSQKFIQWDYINYLFLSLSVQIIGFVAIRKPGKFFVTPLEKLEPHSMSSNQQTERLQSIIQQAITLVEEKKLYQNPQLRLADLARELDSSPHLLSQALNQELGKNFYEFINAYRIEEVKKCLLDPSFSHLTFAAIGQHCGFNSDASFYRIFKKVTGVTPSAYRGMMKEQHS